MIYDYTLTTGAGREVSMKDYDGKVVARFEPTEDMEKVEACVKSLL